MNPVPQVYTAITNVMAKLAVAGIGKERSNAQQNYKFRGIDDVYNALAPRLAEERLVILPRVNHREVVERRTRTDTALFYVTVAVDFVFVSSVDGSTHTVTTYGEAMDSGDKATNKAMSAAFKYACLQAFCIPTEGDNDADATTHTVVAPEAAPQGLPAPTASAASVSAPGASLGSEAQGAQQPAGVAPELDPRIVKLIEDTKTLQALKVVWEGLRPEQRKAHQKLVNAKKKTFDAPAQ